MIVLCTDCLASKSKLSHEELQDADTLQESRLNTIVGK